MDWFHILISIVAILISVVALVYSHKKDKRDQVEFEIAIKERIKKEIMLEVNNLINAAKAICDIQNAVIVERLDNEITMTTKSLDKLLDLYYNLKK